MVSLPGVRGDYYIGLGFFLFFFFAFSFSGAILLMFLMRWNAVIGCCFLEQLLQVAVVYSVPAFGEGFPLVSEMRVVFGDVHQWELFVLWSFCDDRTHCVRT